MASEPTTAATALDRALAAVGDRWTLLVVASLLGGPQRFGDLEESVSGIATNVLTQRLRALQEEGLVA
ncbi:MAG: winged helix-turn-helix transcriptional regulator, partial [Thermoleophilaceae bacterium]